MAGQCVTCIKSMVKTPASTTQRLIHCCVIPCCWAYHRKLFLFKWVVVFAVSAMCLLEFPPTRDVILWPWWPRVWRSVGNFQIYRMKKTPFPKNVTKLSCSTLTEPKVKRSDEKLFSNMRYMKPPYFAGSSVEEMSALKLHHPDHKYFLPTMSKSEAKDLLYIFMVLSQSLFEAEVEFFLEGGSMLGVHRHQGFIPWDDDSDVAINVKDWQKVRAALSCIKGFHLRLQDNMHWAFRRSNEHFPYMDIFFYAEDETYIWALQHYIIRMTLLIPKADMFPLTTGQYEGLSVPVAKNPHVVLSRAFDLDMCVSPDAHHRDHKELPVVKKVKCKDLSYLYQMFNV